MGKHVNPRRWLSATPEQWEKWEEAAQYDRVKFLEWVRMQLDAAAAFVAAAKAAGVKCPGILPSRLARNRSKKRRLPDVSR